MPNPFEQYRSLFHAIEKLLKQYSREFIDIASDVRFYGHRCLKINLFLFLNKLHMNADIAISNEQSTGFVTSKEIASKLLISDRSIMFIDQQPIYMHVCKCRNKGMGPNT